jgi:hypothetical protein
MLSVNLKVLIFFVGVGVGSLFIFWDSITAKSVTKKVGRPYDTSHGLQRYHSRDDLTLKEIFNLARESICFVSITHSIAAEEESLIKQAISEDDLEISIMVLNPENELHIAGQEYIFGEPIKLSISKTLDNLKHLKMHLPLDKRKNLQLFTYDVRLEHSIVVVDAKSSNPFIKIELHPHGRPPNERENRAVFKNDNIGYFTDWFTDYEDISKIAVPYA